MGTAGHTQLPGTVFKAEPPSSPSRAGFLPVPARHRTAYVIAPDNGAGLTKDREVVAQALREAGWHVTCVSPGDLAQSVVSVNFHLEVLVTRLLDLARENVVVPNPEWWINAWTPALTRPGVQVWAKSADAVRLFEGLGGRVRRVGWRSVDRRDLSVTRARAFLHVGGASLNKGTEALIDAWRADWPRLTVVSSRVLRPRGNVTVYKRLSDEELRRLQNEHAFHVYPSHYEGHGHAQWEGLSCGAVVFATDGPPFDECPDVFRLLAARDGACAANKLVRWRDVAPDEIAAAVAWSASVTDADLADLQETSRRAWECACDDFSERFVAALDAVDDGPTRRAPRVKPSSRVLADLPAMAYVGRVRCVTGYGGAARHQIHVLRRHGLRLSVVEAGSTHDPDPLGQDAFTQAARRSDVGLDDVAGTIFHVAPNLVSKWRGRRPLPRPHVLVSVWETTRLPDEWVTIINTFDQVWCATEWQRCVYRDSGVLEQLLRVVPFVVDPSLYEEGAPRAPDERTVFGSVFQWTERKDPTALLMAYTRAFRSDDSVTLVLKSYEGDSPLTGVEGRVASIVGSLGLVSRPPEIRVVSGALSAGDMMDFYKSIDCYVSAHRGEGFGLPIAEALLAGRPVIATDWSAPAEYATGLFRPVKFMMQPPHGMDWQPFYTADQRWAQVDVDDLAEAMREARAGQVVCDAPRVRAAFSALAERAGHAAAAALKEIL